MKNKNLIISNHIVWKDADETVYILQPEQEEVHVLNETGSLIWRFLARGYTFDQIRDEIISRYHVAATKASKDTRDFIDHYTKKKFLLSKRVKKK